jgi:hypothetical protein
MKDWPRIAKLQSALVAHALASGQTRVASYMLTKCQGLSRFLGWGTLRLGIMTTRMPMARLRARMAGTGSGLCATSAGGMWRNSRGCWAS